MAEHIAMPEEDPISSQNFETLKGTDFANLLNKMDNLSSLSSSLAKAQNDETVKELRVTLDLVIDRIKTLQDDLSKPNAIKLAESVIVLLKLLEPSVLENTSQEKLDELIDVNFRNPDMTIQNKNIRKIIESRLDTLENDHQFKELKNHIARLLNKN
ncbi:uncharacterized protein LOC126568883 [Anopheles aquasalis]|uniref:uncharacterized protein LOC126568883 n=1 Tax=Anopheles aquasalis TaxID=42839 RepID=UPI00215B1B7C|nr:uncharacterized protein LOC126568883 [Anopheles aquasalis]XP_050081514.1 uncharacterized protein LOC126568883 [Anopheles aquasalis]XP_050081515.1 uncharacterized protein LOC126568883 [Anopheles aquasalis]